MTTVLNDPRPRTQFPLGALMRSSRVRLIPGILEERSICPPENISRAPSNHLDPIFLVVSESKSNFAINGESPGISRIASDEEFRTTRDWLLSRRLLTSTLTIPSSACAYTPTDRLVIVSMKGTAFCHWLLGQKASAKRTRPLPSR